MHRSERRSAVLWSFAIYTVVLMAAHRSDCAEQIEISIPLSSGRYYTRHDFYLACNTALGTQFSLDGIPDKRYQLSGADLAALRLADRAGVMSFRIEPKRLIIALPDAEDDDVRRQHRLQLGRLFGVSLLEWPAGTGLQIPADFDPQRRSFVLVHGLDSEPADLTRLKTACQARRIQTLTFDYPNDGPIAWSGERLSQDLKRLVTRHPGLRVVIVAHSMGGLVAHYGLETPGMDPGCVTDLIMLGTPHRGSALAGGQDWYEWLTAIKPSLKKSKWSTITDGLGEAAVDLKPGSKFLNTLNRRRRPIGVRYHVAVGTKSFVSADHYQELRSEVNRLLQRSGLSLSRRLSLQQLIDADEWRPGRGDGAVTIDSASLHGVATLKRFDLNHLELIHLPGDPPQASTLFRWILETL